MKINKILQDHLRPDLETYSSLIQYTLNGHTYIQVMKKPLDISGMPSVPASQYSLTDLRRSHRLGMGKIVKVWFLSILGLLP